MTFVLQFEVDLLNQDNKTLEEQIQEFQQSR